MSWLKLVGFIALVLLLWFLFAKYAVPGMEGLRP